MNATGCLPRDPLEHPWPRSRRRSGPPSREGWQRPVRRAGRPADRKGPGVVAALRMSSRSPSPWTRTGRRRHSVSVPGTGAATSPRRARRSAVPAGRWTRSPDGRHSRHTVPGRAPSLPQGRGWAPPAVADEPRLTSTQPGEARKDQRPSLRAQAGPSPRARRCYRSPPAGSPQGRCTAPKNSSDASLSALSRPSLAVNLWTAASSMSSVAASLSSPAW